MERLARIDHAVQHGNVLSDSFRMPMPMRLAVYFSRVFQPCNTTGHSGARPCERGMRLGMIWQRLFGS